MAWKQGSERPTDLSSPVEHALDLAQLIADRSPRRVASEAGSPEAASSGLALRRAIMQAQLSERLRTTAGRATVRRSDSMEALRREVYSYTVALRDEGVTPEGVLISLKAAIRRETLMPLWETSSWSGPRLHETIMTWCIKDYFADKEQEIASGFETPSART